MASAGLDDVFQLVADELGAVVVAGPLDDIFDLVGDGPVENNPRLRRDGFRVPGSQMAEMQGKIMRAGRMARKRPAVSTWVQAKIDEHNLSFAVRPHQVIANLQASRASERIRGSGRWKQWIPTAILRCCFGEPEHIMQTIARQTTNTHTPQMSLSTPPRQNQNHDVHEPKANFPSLLRGLAGLGGLGLAVQQPSS